jgi:hypothetical protein
MERIVSHFLAGRTCKPGATSQETAARWWALATAWPLRPRHPMDFDARPEHQTGYLGLTAAAVISGLPVVAVALKYVIRLTQAFLDMR